MKFNDLKISFIHNVLTGNRSTENGIAKKIYDEIDAAKNTIKIETPYFVLTPDLKEKFQKALERGVKIEIHTNSFGSADNKLPAVSYVVHQKIAEAMGIKVVVNENKYTVHSKTYVFDSKKSIVTTFNLNRRSTFLDSETGVFIEGENLAEALEMDMNRNWKSERKDIGSVTGCLFKILDTAAEKLGLLSQI